MKIISAHKYYWDRDGASRYQLEINRLLEMAGHEVIPFAMQNANNLPSVWSKYFVSQVQTAEPKLSGSAKTIGRMLYSLEAKRNMKALITESKPDVAHIHNIYTQISPSILDALKSARVPAVMTVHDYHLIAPNYMLWVRDHIEDMGKKGLLKSALSKYHKDSIGASFMQSLTFKLHDSRNLYKNGISKFVCPSKFVAGRLLSAGFPDDKICTLPHFIDTANITPSYDGNGIVLFVGRFVEEKGTRFVLDLARSMPDVRFVMLGSGPLLEEMQAHAQGLSNLDAPGWADRSTLAEYYRRASLVLVPSLWHEVFGLVAIEAMAYGKPVLASDMGALPEVVRDGETGRVLPLEQEVWQKEITSLLSKPDEMAEMGKKGRELVETEYSPQKHLESLVRIFEQVQ